MADAPAAAAAAAPSTTPAAPTTPSTPSGKTLAPFDARLQLAKSLLPARVAMPEAETPGGAGDATGGDGDATDGAADAAGGDGDASDGAGDASTAEADGAGDGGDGGDGGDADGPARSEKEQLDAVTKAFESGDIDAMAAALKKQGVKISGPTRRAFRAFARRTQQLDTREQELKERDRDFEEKRARAQQVIADDTRRLSASERELTRRYGTAYELETAWQNEDMLALGKTLERACKGASLAEITQKLATGKAGKTPDEKRMAERERALEERQAAEQRKTAEAEAAKTRAQQREAAIGRVGEGLKAHPYLQMKNDKGETVLDQEALKEVFSAYEASWNGEKFTKTARKCADELHEKLVARAKARGLAPAPAAPPAGKKPPANGKKPVQQRTGVKEPPRSSSRAAVNTDLESTRANRVAAAKRMVEMQRRGVVG